MIHHTRTASSLTTCRARGIDGGPGSRSGRLRPLALIGSVVHYHCYPARSNEVRRGLRAETQACHPASRSAHYARRAGAAVLERNAGHLHEIPFVARGSKRQAEDAVGRVVADFAVRPDAFESCTPPPPVPTTNARMPRAGSFLPLGSCGANRS